MNGASFYQVQVDKLIVNIPLHMPRTGSVAVFGRWAQSQGHFIRRADLELEIKCELRAPMQWIVCIQLELHL